jgi:hypothetical protein
MDETTGVGVAKSPAIGVVLGAEIISTVGVASGLSMSSGVPVGVAVKEVTRATCKCASN